MVFFSFLDCLHLCQKRGWTSGSRKL